MEQEEVNLDRGLGRLEGQMRGIVDSMKTVSDEIRMMRVSFDNLEKGRLSALEVAFAKMQTEVSDKTKSTALRTSMVVAVIISVLAAILTGVIHKYLGL